VLDLLKQHYDPTYAASIGRNFSEYGQANQAVLPERSPSAFKSIAAQLIQIES